MSIYMEIFNLQCSYVWWYNYNGDYKLLVEIVFYGVPDRSVQKKNKINKNYNGDNVNNTKVFL